MIRTVALLWTASLAMPSGAQPVLTWQGGGGFSAAFYQMETLARKDLDAFSFGIQLDLTPRFYQVFALRAEGGLGFFGPICLDVDEPAHCSARKTSVMALSGALATGIYAPALRLGGRRDFLYLSPALFVGREWITAWRGEAQCLNCIDERIQLDGGFFLEPGLDVSFSRDAGVGASYRLYEGASDLRGRLTVRFFVKGSAPRR